MRRAQAPKQTRTKTPRPQPTKLQKRWNEAIQRNAPLITAQIRASASQATPNMIAPTIRVRPSAGCRMNAVIVAAAMASVTPPLTTPAATALAMASLSPITSNLHFSLKFRRFGRDLRS